MRMAIFGASGGTGGHLVTQGLAAGHTLVALARDPARVATAHDRLRVVQGDVYDPAAVEAVVDGSDGVVVSLTPTQGDHRGFFAAATDNIVTAMERSGTHRMVAISAAPLAPDGPDDTLPYRVLIKPLLRRFLRDLYTGMEVMEQRLRDSDLQWTVLRPPRLTDKPATGRYRTAVNGTLRRGYLLSRADLADAALAALGDVGTARATVGVGD